MQIYEVTGRDVVFGMGVELQLSDRQAEIRSSSIRRKKNDIYEVLEPIQFKQGELVLVATENLSKSVLENLMEISAKESEGKKSQSSDRSKENKGADNAQYPCIAHVSFGKYNVFDENKNLLTDKPIKKDEAEKLLLEILEKNQKADDANQNEEKGKEVHEDSEEDKSQLKLDV